MSAFLALIGILGAALGFLIRWFWERDKEKKAVQKAALKRMATDRNITEIWVLDNQEVNESIKKQREGSNGGNQVH